MEKNKITDWIFASILLFSMILATVTLFSEHSLLFLKIFLLTSWIAQIYTYFFHGRSEES